MFAGDWDCTKVECPYNREDRQVLHSMDSALAIHVSRG